MIANARKVLDAASPNQDHGVLLKVVTDAGDIGGHLHPVGQTHLATLRRAELGFLGVWV